MIKIFTTGGTIDKVYFDAKNDYHVGESEVAEILKEANVNVPYELECLMRKDSLDLTDGDRQLIYDRITHCDNRHILLTHGTDTMVKTAQKLLGVSGKIIVLTGSMFPARFRSSDAIFNVGFAFGACQVLTDGVYIAMNGRIFDPDRVQKNVELNKFVATSSA